MSSHWFEQRGCPECKHVWGRHCFSDDRLFMRQVQPFVVNEELICPKCKHNFVYPVVHNFARHGYGIDLKEPDHEQSQ